MIRVHLIRHCYPSLSAISDMGIKCWTCFWVILGAHGATTYTPLNQWGLGFVAKPQEQHKSVFPEQSPCPRSAPSEKWAVKSAVSPRPALTSSLSVFELCVWSEEWQLLPPQQEQRKHWASKKKQQSNNQPFLWQRLADAAVFMICLLPPLISTLLPQWMTKKSPF